MYLITFTDNTTHKGGDLYHSHWNDMPNKNIAKIEYEFPNQKILIKGYEKYNHIIDQVYINGKCRFEKIRLMGLEKNIVKSFIYSFADHQMTVHENRFGEEHGGKPTTGWKIGVVK